MTALQVRLFALRDEPFLAFQAGLNPAVPRERMMGVRTPELRRLAKELWKSGEAEAFLAELPHQWFEENQLHAFLLSEMKDFGALMERLEAFLPHVDNWATCDQLRPKCLVKHRAELLPYIDRWLTSAHTYTVRFAMGMLMTHYLDGDFSPEHLQKVAAVESGEYYIRMMQAWYFATALAKQPEAALPILTEGRLESWTHNKTIQKARESYRISAEQKEYLKTLRR